MKNLSPGKEHVEIVRHHKKSKSSNYREGKNEGGRISGYYRNPELVKTQRTTALGASPQ